MVFKDALDILVALAICMEPELTCEEDCPLYINNKDCVVEFKNNLVEAVNCVKEHSKNI